MTPNVESVRTFLTAEQRTRALKNDSDGRVPAYCSLQGEMAVATLQSTQVLDEARSLRTIPAIFQATGGFDSIHSQSHQSPSCNRKKSVLQTGVRRSLPQIALGRTKPGAVYVHR